MIGTPRDVIAALAADGHTDAEIGAALDPPRTAWAIAKFRARHGIPAGVRPGGQLSGWEDTVRDLHADGLTSAEIAERSGYTLRTVWQYLYLLRLRANEWR